MGWPTGGPSSVPPSFDSGIAFPGTPNSTALADVPNILHTDPAWLIGLHVANTRSTGVLFSLTDGSGVTLVPALMIPSGSIEPLEWPFLPVTGLQWKVTDMSGAGIPSGVNAKVWGYK